MRNRASTWNLLLSLAAYLVFMAVLLAAIGFGVGTVELLIWLVILGVGVALIVRRHRRALSSTTDPSIAMARPRDIADN